MGPRFYHTLHDRIGALPDDVVILPAHYSNVSEIRDDGVVRRSFGEIRRTVPELQLRSEEEFVEAMKVHSLGRRLRYTPGSSKPTWASYRPTPKRRPNGSSAEPMRRERTLGHSPTDSP